MTGFFLSKAECTQLVSSTRRMRLLAAVASSAASFLFAPASAQVDATTLSCETGSAARSADGKLRLAFIVGVDSYQDAKPLKGAVADAGKIYDLITDPADSAFPRQNICVLTNAEATYEGFRGAFKSAIVARAEGAEEVLIYYAGHGSQLEDDNNDDGDGWDETLFLHDSARVEKPDQGIRYAQVRDDEFNEMLAALEAKTENFTVILDSCHSGTATRDIESDEIARAVDPVETARATPSAAAGRKGEGSFSYAHFAPASFKKAVFMSAARDDEKAIERSGEGLFTKALLSVLRDPQGGKITYDQLQARTKAELGVMRRQTPVLSGNGDRLVFSSDVPYKPRFDWVVSDASGNTAVIRGLPTIGMGEGAEFLILPGSMTAEEAQDPNIAKARMRAATQLAGNEWRLELMQNFNRGAIEPRDYAALAVPSKAARKLKVRIRPASEPGGVVNGQALRQAVVEELSNVMEEIEVPLIVFVPSNFDLEISVNKAGAYQIADSQSILRNAYDDVAPEKRASALAEDLANHFQQIVLLGEWKIRGGTMVPNETLQVRLKPVVSDDMNVCRKPYEGTDWPAPANAPQRIPLCAAYEIEVKLHDNAPDVPVVVGGSMLSADGSMAKIPFDNRRIEIKKGGDWTSFGRDNGFQATPDSYGKIDNLYMIALPAISTAGEPAYEIPWHLLSTFEPRTRQVSTRRGERPQKEYGTYTIVPIETVANSKFGEETGGELTDEAISREYTIDSFSIAPYLPDDPNSALHKVLKVAESLTDYDGTGDGVAYKQHAWCKGSTKANLAAGIDCSRAIWYAFTRAGLAYNRHAASVPDEAQCVNPYDPTKDGYLYTGDMARKSYLMSDEFADCLAKDENEERAFKLGDVLVYRDKTKGDGHVVMVIDPVERIAWGSHGWDGNPRLIDPDTGAAPDPDRGVEFQKIKFKSDWERWDRGTMELAACWRHKQIAEEAKSERGRPGYASLCQAMNLDLDPEDYPGIESNLCWRLLRN